MPYIFHGSLFLRGDLGGEGGLSVGTKTMISLRVKDIIGRCVRVRAGPMGGGGRGGVRRTGDSVIVPCFKHLARLKGVGGV